MTAGEMRQVAARLDNMFVEGYEPASVSEAKDLIERLARVAEWCESPPSLWRVTADNRQQQARDKEVVRAILTAPDGGEVSR